MFATDLPFREYFDLSGQPLDSGYIYFGQPNQNPETAPITVYWDADGTQPALQPVRTTNGLVVRNGAIANLYTNGNYSITIRDRNGALVIYAPIADKLSLAAALADSADPANGASMIGYLGGTLRTYLNQFITSAGASIVGWIQSGAGAVLRLAQDKMRDTVHVKDFLPAGYVTDASVDYVVYIQRAIDEAQARGVGKVDCSGGRWLIDSADLNVKEGVTLVGPYENLGESTGINYSTIKSAFIVNPLYTIRLNGDFAGIKGLGVFKKDLTVPASLADATALVATFSGKGITVGDGTNNKANDTYAGHCLILGFQYAYYNDFNERPRVEYISGDCTNGIYMSQVYDMDHLSHCHFWPFLTAHQSWTLTGAAGYRRNGTGYYFNNSTDWGQADNCFAYGYDNGFVINNSDHTELVNCGADNNAPGGDTTTIGFSITGTSKNTKLIGPKAAAQGRGIVINLSLGGDVGGVVTIDSVDLWGNLTNHINLIAGRLNLVSGSLSHTVTDAGLKIDATAYDCQIGDAVEFDSITTPISAAGAVANRLTVGNPRFFNCVDLVIGGQIVKDNQLGISSCARYSADVNGFQYRFRKARGSVAAPTIAISNDQAFVLKGQAWDGAMFQDVGHIVLQTQGTVAAGATPGVLLFATSPAGSVTPVQRLALDSAGTLYPMTDNAYALGKAANRYSEVWAANGTIQTSDARTKKNITNSTLGLDFINALRPVSYKWIEGGKKVIRQEPNEDGSPGEIITESMPGTRTHWGLIAQEVKAVCDAAGVDFGGHVLTDINDPDSQQAIRYDQFISPLIKAVQELTARVQALEARAP